MRTQVGALLLLAALLLAGCQTKYQETGLTGGYKDKQLGPDRYQISASGNGYTSEQRIADMMMLRAAELTLQHGYARFLVETQNTRMKTTYGSSGPMLIPIDWPAGSMTIRMLKPGDAAAGAVHDAAQVKAALASQLPKG
jgi:hypothetical protein